MKIFSRIVILISILGLLSNIFDLKIFFDLSHNFKIISLGSCLCFFILGMTLDKLENDYLSPKHILTIQILVSLVIFIGFLELFNFAWIFLLDFNTNLTSALKFLVNENRPLYMSPMTALSYILIGSLILFKQKSTKKKYSKLFKYSEISLLSLILIFAFFISLAYLYLSLLINVPDLTIPMPLLTSFGMIFLSTSILTDKGSVLRQYFSAHISTSHTIFKYMTPFVIISILLGEVASVFLTPLLFESPPLATASLIIFIILGSILFSKVISKHIGGKIEELSKTLREKQRLLVQTSELANVGGWEINAETKEVNWTNQSKKIFGIPKDTSPTLQDINSYYIDKDRAKMEATLQKALKTGEGWNEEFRLKNTEGKLIWIHSIGNADIVNNRIEKIYGIIQDITERKLAEKEINNKEEEYRTLAENSLDIIIRYNSKHRIIYANSAIELETGIAVNDLCGKTYQQAGFPDDLCTFWERSISQVFSTQKPETGLFQLKDQDGLLKTFDWRVFPELNNDGIVESVISISRNITEYKLAEEELLKVEKLKSLGVLAGGIAHDFNNFLTMLFASISIAKSNLENDHASTKYLQMAEETFHRATNLTNQLLTFSKGGAPIKDNIELNKLIEEIVSFDLTGSNVKLNFKANKDLWKTQVDKGQMEQVFSNLVINAKQAMPTGGTLNISMENIEILQSKESAPIRPGSYVKVTIQDEGIGISPEDLDQIFDPYFTTKDTGNGLGLATVYSIITKHAGHITAKSVIGAGTTFSVYIPASESIQASTLTKKKPVFSIQGNSKRILVMDDEEMIRVLSKQMLENSGYQVSLASNGDQAIEMYQRSLMEDQPYDCVIMDLTIPGGKGGKVAIGEILKIDPEAKAIVSSGYSTDIIMANYAQYGFKGVMAKPFSMNTMNQLLDSVLNEE